MALCCAGLLTACAAQPQVKIEPPPMPPARLMDCPAALPIPEKELLMETDVAFLLRDFYVAHRTCRARLHSLSRFLRETSANK